MQRTKKEKSYIEKENVKHGKTIHGIKCEKQRTNRLSSKEKE